MMRSQACFDFVQIEPPRKERYGISLTPEILAALTDNCTVAFSISGGKDSVVSAHATSVYLDSIGHAGPRVLIHSDLGAAEWQASLLQCELLAERLRLELIVVRREKGVRRQIGELMAYPVRYITGREVIGRYRELLAEKGTKAA